VAKARCCQSQEWVDLENQMFDLPSQRRFSP
jgi:hypothetical protein